jgi:dUTP pyrophosphatase
MKLNVKIKRLDEGAVIPKYAHEHDSGVDLVAVEDVIVEPGATVLVSTGLSFEIPPGYEMQIRPRSGVTLKTKLRVQLGTIDSGYRGEVKVIVDNIAEYRSQFGDEMLRESFVTMDGGAALTDGLYRTNTYIIRKGDRIAQAVFAPVETCNFIDADKLEKTMRGAGGFGSTGVKEAE